MKSLRSSRKFGTRLTATVLTIAFALTTAACTTKTSMNEEQNSTSQNSKEDKTIKLIAYESFPLSDETIQAFEKESGYKLEVIKSGDGVEMTNKLILTKDSPIADVAFGMNAAVVSAAIDAGVFIDRDFDLPQGVQKYEIPGTKKVTPVDHGQVCLNYDIKWFEDKNLTPPAEFEDLLKPEMKDLTVTLDPRSSTPGLSFMLATVAKFGEGKWAEYWEKLSKNGMKVAKGWSEAWAGDFTAGSNESKTADRPIMVSYSSSPAWAANSDNTATTIGNVPSTCWNDIEYVGVLAGTKHVEGAQKLAEFFLGEEVQQEAMEKNYVYPVREGMTMPEALAKFGKESPTNFSLDPREVNKQREAWLRTWTQAVGG